VSCRHVSLSSLLLAASAVSSSGAANTRGAASSSSRVPEEANVQDLLRHVRNMGSRVERDLDGLRNLEKKFADASEDDASLASQHFHIDVGGDDGGERVSESEAGSF
jgi:hypothetical protein